jgi:HSP20 family protein
MMKDGRPEKEQIMSDDIPERSTSLTEQREPKREFEQVVERTRRFLDQTFTGRQSRSLSAGRRVWSPPVDVEESDDGYVLEAELPSVQREDVNVEVSGNEVQIAGEIKEREHTGTLRRQMRRTGRFAYRITLPTRIDGDKVDARLADGVLTVRIPRAEQDEHRQIEITS